MKCVLNGVLCDVSHCRHIFARSMFCLQTCSSFTMHRNITFATFELDKLDDRYPYDAPYEKIAAFCMNADSLSPGFKCNSQSMPCTGGKAAMGIACDSSDTASFSLAFTPTSHTDEEKFLLRVGRQQWISEKHSSNDSHYGFVHFEDFSSSRSKLQQEDGNIYGAWYKGVKK